MTDLTDRMRTCAAFMERVMIEATDIEGAVTLASRVPHDAIALLREAADALDKPQPLGEPMEIITPQKLVPTSPVDAQWVGPGDALPANIVRSRNPRVCPKCDSRADKKVILKPGCQPELRCPACGHLWPYTGVK